MDLEQLAQRIQNIENKDPNYLNNEQWKKLRKFQDDCYEKMARQQISEIELQLNYEKNENKIKSLKDKQVQLKKYLEANNYEQSY